MNPNGESWYADAFLQGAAGLTTPTYPGLLELRHPSGTGVVQIALEAPFEAPDGGAFAISQHLELAFRAQASVAHEIAAEAVSRVADRLAFLTGRPVNVEIGAVTTAPLGSTGGSYKSIGRGVLERVVPKPAFARVTDLTQLQSTAAADHVASRALRWLRRSYTTEDVVLMFAALVFGLEALAPGLNTSPTPGEGISHPSNADRIRHLAVTECGVPQDAWRKVGGARHQLFHGGLTEDEDMRESIVFAAGWAEYVLVSAIKLAYGMPSSGPPIPTRPGGSMTNVHMSVEGPAEHMRPGKRLTSQE